MIGIIGIACILILGLLCIFAPGLTVRKDKRDDPEAIAQVKKVGLMLIAFAIGAGLLLMKYEMF